MVTRAEGLGFLRGVPVMTDIAASYRSNCSAKRRRFSSVVSPYTTKWSLDASNHAAWAPVEAISSDSIHNALRMTPPVDDGADPTRPK